MFMPPYFDFHVYNVTSAKPCLRESAATDTPASCSFKTPMIFSSVSRFLFDADLPRVYFIGKSHLTQGSAL